MAIDVFVPNDTNMWKEEYKKLEKFQGLKKGVEEM